MREGTPEAASRVDRCADDHELRAAFGRDSRHLLAEASRPRADELAPHRHTVRARNRGRIFELLLQGRERAVHVGVEWQLALHDQRPDEDDSGAPVGGEPAREVQGMLRLRLVEQRHDDAPVGNRTGPAREMPRPVVQEPDVRKPHFRSWYGTEARITFGSKRRRRLR